MLKVKFYENVEDRLLSFAVIVARADNKWVFCKHKDRATYEVPGGHREPDELILDTAKRELQEETGTVDFKIEPICIYSVIKQDTTTRLEEETFGMLYYAEVARFDDLPDYEMEEVLLQEEYPVEWTYPLIQPILMEKVMQYMNNRNLRV